MFSFEETKKYIKDHYRVTDYEEWDNGDLVLVLVEDAMDVMEDVISNGCAGHIFMYDLNSVVVSQDVVQYLGEDYEYFDKEDIENAQIHVTESKYFVGGMRELSEMTFDVCSTFSNDEGLTPAEITEKRVKLEHAEDTNVYKFTVEFEDEDNREDFLDEWCDSCSRLWAAEYNGFNTEYIREIMAGTGLRDAVTGKYIIACNFEVFEDYEVAEPMDGCGGSVDASLLEDEEFIRSCGEDVVDVFRRLVERYTEYQKNARVDISVFQKGICISSPYATGIGKFLIEATNNEKPVNAEYMLCAGGRAFDGIDWYDDGFYCMGSAADLGQKVSEEVIKRDTYGFLAMLSLVNPCEDLDYGSDARLNGWRVYEWSKDSHVIGLELINDD